MPNNIGKLQKYIPHDRVYKMTVTQKQVKKIIYALSHGLTVPETAAYAGVSPPSVTHYRDKVNDAVVYPNRRPPAAKQAHFLLEFLAGTGEPIDNDEIYKHICEHHSGAAPKKEDLGSLLCWLEEIKIVSTENYGDKIKYRLNDEPWM